MHIMKIFMLLILPLFFQKGFAVEHYLRFFITAYTGTKDTPEFFAYAKVDDIQIGHCNSAGRTESQNELERRFSQDHLNHNQDYVEKCENVKNIVTAQIKTLNQQMNKTEGVHTLQLIEGCKWNNVTEEKAGFRHYGYDGEDFIFFDPGSKNSPWVAKRPEAVNIADQWGKKASWEHYLWDLNRCSEWLKTFLGYLKQFKKQTAAPSISLLQKNPSSPVSCHITGFYPAEAVILWRRDGLEVGEDKQNWEVLPNHDGTFQKTVELHISLIEPEDWREYECVFYQSGVEEIVTRGGFSFVFYLSYTLHRIHILKSLFAVVAVPPSESPGTTVVAVIVPVLLLLALCIFGLYLWRRKCRGFQPVNSCDPPASQTFSDATNQQMTQLSDKTPAQDECNKESCG